MFRCWLWLAKVAAQKSILVLDTCESSADAQQPEDQRKAGRNHKLEGGKGESV